jgi:murein DD-endopeptidase MepM/ murein hydrolase activator NlpD
MNYSQKRTLIGRIVYIGLTLMAVTVLCVTMFVFFGSSKESGKNKLPPVTAPNTQKPPVTTQKGEDERPPDVTTKPEESDKPTVVPPPEKDWTKETLTMPVEGTVMKRHDLLNAVYSATMNDYRVHKGIDIECSIGDDVLCVAYGTVVSVGLDPFMGCTVTIDHGDGLISIYRNLDTELPENVKAGEEIFEGDVIGSVGESAIIEIADEPHLHFELSLDGASVDPLDFFDYQPTVSPDEDESIGK